MVPRGVTVFVRMDFHRLWLSADMESSQRFSAMEPFHREGGHGTSSDIALPGRLAIVRCSMGCQTSSVACAVNGSRHPAKCAGDAFDQARTS